MIKPQGVFLFGNGNALAKSLLYKRGGGGADEVFLEVSHNTLNAVLLIAAAGEGAPNDRIRHLTGRNKRAGTPLESSVPALY